MYLLGNWIRFAIFAYPQFLPLSREVAYFECRILLSGMMGVVTTILGVKLPTCPGVNSMPRYNIGHPYPAETLVPIKGCAPAKANTCWKGMTDGG